MSVSVVVETRKSSPPGVRLLSMQKEYFYSQLLLKSRRWQIANFFAVSLEVPGRGILFHTPTAVLVYRLTASIRAAPCLDNFGIRFSFRGRCLHRIRLPLTWDGYCQSSRGRGKFSSNRAPGRPRRPRRDEDLLDQGNSKRVAPTSTSRTVTPPAIFSVFMRGFCWVKGGIVEIEKTKRIRHCWRWARLVVDFFDARV